MKKDRNKGKKDRDKGEKEMPVHSPTCLGTPQCLHQDSLMPAIHRKLPDYYYSGFSPGILKLGRFKIEFVSES